ncbi:MAG: PIN domain-containing protein [Acidobacteriota bacterium]
MNVLLDTDVILDVVLDRTPHVDASASLLDAVERKDNHGFIAWHSVSNVYYLARPKTGDAEVRLFLLELVRFVEIAPTTTESLLYATQLEMADFEDALQVAAAAACSADVIATRNIRDFRHAPIPAATPAAILQRSERS